MTFAYGEFHELCTTVKRNARNTFRSDFEASKYDDYSDRLSNLVDKFLFDKHRAWLDEQQKQGKFLPVAKTRASSATDGDRAESERMATTSGSESAQTGGVAAEGDDVHDAEEDMEEEDAESRESPSVSCTKPKKRSRRPRAAREGEKKVQHSAEVRAKTVEFVKAFMLKRSFECEKRGRISMHVQYMKALQLKWTSGEPEFLWAIGAPMPSRHNVFYWMQEDEKQRVQAQPFSSRRELRGAQKRIAVKQRRDFTKAWSAAKKQFMKLQTSRLTPPFDSLARAALDACVKSEVLFDALLDPGFYSELLCLSATCHIYRMMIVDVRKDFLAQVRYFVTRKREAEAEKENLAKNTADDLDVARLVEKVNEGEGGSAGASAGTSQLEESSRQVKLVFPEGKQNLIKNLPKDLVRTLENSGDALQIDEMEFLGRGTYGAVFGVKNPEGKIFVLKVLLERVQEYEIASKIAEEAKRLLCNFARHVIERVQWAMFRCQVHSVRLHLLKHFQVITRLPVQWRFPQWKIPPCFTELW